MRTFTGERIANRKGVMIATVAVLMMASFLVMGCGGGVKGLAKQTYDLSAKATEITSDPTSGEALKYAAKAAALAEKVEKLSDKDKEAYEAELAALVSGVKAEKPAKQAKAKGGGKANSATDFKYAMNAAGDGVEIIRWISLKGGKVVIPSEIEGFPVVGIASSAFEEAMNDKKLPDNYKRITEVVIPDSVTKIVNGQYAGAFGVFSNCKSLKSVTLSKNLKTIVEVMFNDCESLSSISIPESVQTIEAGAFQDCKELSDVKLPSHSIKYMGAFGENLTKSNAFNGAFVGCQKLSLATRKAITDSGYLGDF